MKTAARNAKIRAMFEVPKRTPEARRKFRAPESTQPPRVGEWSPALALAALAMSASAVFVSSGLAVALGLYLSLAALARSKSEACRSDSVWVFASLAIAACALAACLNLFSVRERFAAAFTTNLQHTDAHTAQPDDE